MNSVAERKHDVQLFIPYYKYIDSIEVMMTTARQFYEQHPDLALVSPSKNWPTMYDLPSEDPGEPGLPDEIVRGPRACLRG